ncbi:unnamed protein product [Symbiodinium natans]|uniref:PPPDE domain-containing protein n=1 Tax=Symbiodinium natans TaxID=878477 RepID=A0A812NBN1_9DINO|nr:unnamed protein product [Symbiodinium natans]
MCRMADQASCIPRSGGFVEDHFRDASCLRQASHCLQEVFTATADTGGSQVLVHVYELVEFVRLNQILASELMPIGGALHAGVEVYGREWSFGGAPGRRTGVVCEVPRTNRKHRFRETISLGTTRLSASEVALVIGDLIERWLGEDYHWLHRNCLHFANEFCRKLGVGSIPAWIDRLPRGVCALDVGVRNLAETVKGLADGTRAAAHAIAEGQLDCVRCRPVCSFDPSCTTTQHVNVGSFMVTAVPTSHGSAFAAPQGLNGGRARGRLEVEKCSLDDFVAAVSS